MKENSRMRVAEFNGEGLYLSRLIRHW